MPEKDLPILEQEVRAEEYIELAMEQFDKALDSIQLAAEWAMRAYLRRADMIDDHEWGSMAAASAYDMVSQLMIFQEEMYNLARLVESLDYLVPNKPVQKED